MPIGPATKSIENPAETSQSWKEIDAPVTKNNKKLNPKQNLPTI